MYVYGSHSVMIFKLLLLNFILKYSISMKRRSHIFNLSSYMTHKTESSHFIFQTFDTQNLCCIVSLLNDFILSEIYVMFDQVQANTKGTPSNLHTMW